MRGEAPEVEPAPPQHESAYSPEGVDLTFIRWMLSLTPAERLRTLEQCVRSLSSLVCDRADA